MVRMELKDVINTLGCRANWSGVIFGWATSGDELDETHGLNPVP